MSQNLGSKRDPQVMLNTEQNSSFTSYTSSFADLVAGTATGVWCKDSFWKEPRKHRIKSAPPLPRMSELMSRRNARSAGTTIEEVEVFYVRDTFNFFLVE